MKYTATLPSGRIASIETALAITHALIGHRNEVPERPPEEELDTPLENLAPERAQAVRTFRMQKARGRYSMIVLAWMQTLSEATTLMEQFPEPEWTGHQVVPASKGAIRATG